MKTKNDNPVLDGVLRDNANTVKRKSISKRTRFEVFKRDSFKCQYCGAAAPEVILQIDHIDPVAHGGNQTDIVNLITSCISCNSGKSDKRLSDNTAMNKRKAQLDDLQERREQLEMMSEWQLGLLDLSSLEVQQCSELWSQVTGGCYLTDKGTEILRGYLSKFGQLEVMEAMRKASRYLRTQDGKVTLESVCDAFDKVGGICFLSRRVKSDPELPEIYRLRSMITSRIPTIHASDFMISVQKLRAYGYTVAELRSKFEPIYKWWEFRNAVEAMLSDEDTDG